MVRKLLAQGLEKSYKGRKVVHGVSLEVNSGQVIGLLGPNGAGKTTTFYMVVGLIQPDKGRILLDDQDLTGLPIYTRARIGISYLPQEQSVFHKLNVENNLLAILETLGISRTEQQERKDQLLEDFRLTHLAKSLSYTLSGGEQRRLEIARALVIEPAFILMDEPFAGIDPIAVINIQNIISQLKNKGIGVLISDHNVRETLGVCDQAYILNHGEILEFGEPDLIAVSPKAKEIYLGEKFKL
ncbi:MAG: LPS export ABC transporter ATP-binding protein [Desulfobacterales bacterium SG8_35]|nr:MAG: LPS export ABC transporter ATP-binding protein [Desulfobacterales bacterium SG8_35]